MGIKTLLLHGLILGGLFICISCGISNNETPEEKLDAYCVRECVLEIGDSSLCDTKCDCASQILSEKLSNDEFSKLVIGITGGNSKEAEGIKEFKEAIKRCKSTKF